VAGIATLRVGGHTFQPDGSVNTWLVSYKDVALELYGLVALADAQHAADGNLYRKVCGC